MQEEKTLSQTLADNLAYYVNDTNKRNVTNGGVCTYSGKTLGIDTDGCFVGRMLSEKNRLRADNNNIGTVQALVTCGSKYNITVPQIISDNILLFQCFQGLHDAHFYWGKNSLSERGKKRLSEIIVEHKLSQEDFQKFL
jgi:hypothetical protein